MVNIDCEQVWREISNYLEGEVESSLCAVMDEHFLTCQRCRSVLEGTQNVIRLYSDERMIEVPAGFGRRLERMLAQKTRVPRRGWSSLSGWLVPLAALALLAGGLRLANSLTMVHPLLSEHAQPGRGIPPDLQVIVSEGAKVFHVAGCTFIHNKDRERTLTAREAIREGYVPCLRCLRKYLDTSVVGRNAVWGDDEVEDAQVEDLHSER